VTARLRKLKVKFVPSSKVVTLPDLAFAVLRAERPGGPYDADSTAEIRLPSAKSGAEIVRSPTKAIACAGDTALAGRSHASSY
jgi:hypothetical protein